MTHPDKEKYIVLGKFGAPYGVRGMLRVISFTEQGEDIFGYKNLFIKDKTGNNGKIISPITFESWNAHGGDLVAKVKGYDDRDLVKSLTNLLIVIKETELPKLEDGDFYWSQLISLTVVNKENYNLGVVKSILETGSNDVLVIKPAKDDKYNQSERLVPFIQEQVILKVDLANKVILVDWDAEF